MIENHFDGSIARAFKTYLKNDIEAFLMHHLSTTEHDHIMKECSKGHEMKELAKYITIAEDYICQKCNKRLGKIGNIYECAQDKEWYHKDCGGLNEKEGAEAAIARKVAA